MSRARNKIYNSNSDASFNVISTSSIDRNKLHNNYIDASLLSLICFFFLGTLFLFLFGGGRARAC